MRQRCMEDMPPGFDPNKDKFSPVWCKKFMKRKELSVRKKTNFKAKSVWERLHKIHNYHHFTVYRMGNEAISDISESSFDDSDSQDVIQDFGSDVSGDSSESAGSVNLFLTV